MLMNFKNCAEDEDCPIPDEVRESMIMFHSALLAHCGKTAIIFFVYSQRCGAVSKLKRHSKVFISKKKRRRPKWIILFAGGWSVCWKR